MNKSARQTNIEQKESMNLEPTEQGIIEPESRQPLARQDNWQPSTDHQTAQPSTDHQMAQPSTPELWSRRLSGIVFAVMTAVILVSVIYKPATVNPGEEYFTICGFKNLTGLPCPGCGLTHSFCEIGKGHIASAADFNLLGLPLFLLMLLIWCKALFVLTKQFKPAFALDRLAVRLKPLRWFAIAFALYGVGRIVYILLYNPSARTGNPFAKLFSLITG